MNPTGRHGVRFVVTVVLAASLVPAASEAKTPQVFSPGFARAVATVPAGASTTALVRFTAGTAAERRSLVEARGLRVLRELRALDVLAVSGPIARVKALGSHPWVGYVEDDRPLELHGSTAVWATRVGVVRNAVSGGPYRAGSAIIDGAGIGVGVVDSGVDATHPDLINRVVSNYKMAIDSNLGSGTHTDSTSGHGTHVSGIVAGDGTSSNGTFTGVAPGAKLHVFSSGEVLSVLFAAAALETIYDGYESFTPRIRVINNSWGNPAGSAYNANGAIERVVKKLVEDKGVTVMFSAGNSGGNGSVDSTSSYCKDPTPGVICVANYDDDESGARDFKLDATSSRGRNGQPDKYPDISAPGAFITSTFLPTSGALYGSLVFPEPGWAPSYGDAGGTSMAAPHLSGIVALLLQANPSLTPAVIENVLQDTAHKFTAGGAYLPDPQNSGGTIAFDKGAGLADAVAALQDPRVGATGDNAASPAVLVTGDGGDYPGPGAADLVGLSATASATGITYQITVADAEDRAPINTGLRVLANYDGVSRTTTVTLRPDGTVAPVAAEGPDDDATAEASSAARAGNVITFFVPYDELGNPGSGAPVHNVFAASYLTLVQDVAPSPASAPPPSAGDLILRPLFAPPFPTA